jgi:hypothetical protein
MAPIEPLKFTGTILRLELDGFGLVQFDEPLGPHANSYGVISSSTGTATMPGTLFLELKPGVRVVGTAEPNDRDVASVKTITVGSAS